MNSANTFPTEHLPIGKLLAFTLAGFITIMTEIIPAGLLPLISKDLGISESLAGQLISVYALGSVVAAIPIVSATRSWSRKSLFLLAISGLFIFNSLTAISSNYIVILFLRFFAGMSAGVIWGILAGYARYGIWQSTRQSYGNRWRWSTDCFMHGSAYSNMAREYV